MPLPSFSVSSPEEEMRMHARIVEEAGARDERGCDEAERPVLSTVDVEAAAAAQREADESAELEALLA